jgi:peroxiredoxin
MKNLKILLLLSGLFCVQNLLAQTEPHLKLSNPYPEVGQKLTLTYDPKHTVVDGKKSITGVVYFLDNKSYPAADIDLKSYGKLLKGEFVIPQNTKAFYIKIAGDNEIDNNNEKGYVYAVYKGKVPVTGAYAMQGYMLSSGMGTALAKIKLAAPEGTALFKKEFVLHPEVEKEYQGVYYLLLARNPDNKALVADKINKLEASSDEKDLRLASTLLRGIYNPKGADSLIALVKAKFPNGITAKADLSTSFAKEQDMGKKLEIYNIITAHYPEDPADKTTSHDYYKIHLATAYLTKGDMGNFEKYASIVNEKAGLAGALNNAAYEWAKKGEHLQDAEKLSKQSLDILKEKIVNPQPGAYAPASQVKKSSQNTYNTYADTYAFILFKESKFEEALKYQQEVIDAGGADAEVNQHYIAILNANGKFDKAKDVAEKAVISGQSNNVINEELKKAYVKVKGSDAGYDGYLAAMADMSKNKAKAELAKTMINKPAPAFTLKDLDGKAVSLADLKGKTIIVDFWATWCGPCKASFPGMQIALSKYKDDPNVKFLFIDTWETGEDFVSGVKKFIGDNKYSFHVLLDEKGNDGRQSKVVSKFDVSGIPTKFVIDKTGNIRFKYVGYSGSTEKVIDEVVNMIELASNPDVAITKAGEAVEVKTKE